MARRSYRVKATDTIYTVAAYLGIPPEQLAARYPGGFTAGQVVVMDAPTPTQVTQRLNTMGAGVPMPPTWPPQVAPGINMNWSQFVNALIPQVTTQPQALNMFGAQPPTWPPQVAAGGLTWPQYAQGLNSLRSPTPYFTRLPTGQTVPYQHTIAELPPYQLQNNIYPAPPRGTAPTTVVPVTQQAQRYAQLTNRMGNMPVGWNYGITPQQILTNTRKAMQEGYTGGGYGQLPRGYVSSPYAVGNRTNIIGTAVPEWRKNVYGWSVPGYNVPMPETYGQANPRMGFVQSRGNINRPYAGEYSGYVPGENGGAGYWVGIDPRTGTRTPTRGAREYEWFDTTAPELRWVWGY